MRGVAQKEGISMRGREKGRQQTRKQHGGRALGARIVRVCGDSAGCRVRGRDLLLLLHTGPTPSLRHYGCLDTYE